MIECFIKFDENPLAVYFANSIIKGKVEILLNEVTVIQCILLKITGKTNVNWSENTTGTSNLENKTFTACENYLNSITYLIGSNKADETVKIESGSHTFDFSCKLPPNLPTSFEGIYGQIRYTATVILDRPNAINKQLTAGFTILNILDLNQQDQSLRLNSIIETEKKFMFWLCTSKPLKIQISTPQTGFACGQKILTNVQIFNQSGQQIENLKVYLIRIVNYTSDYPDVKKKIEQIAIAITYITTITSEQIQNFSAELIVPSTPASTIATSQSGNVSNFIDIQYELRVKAKLSGFHLSPIAVIPIMIGSIPLISNKIENTSNRNEIESPNETNSLEILSVNYGLAPPSYEEAVAMTKVKFISDEETSQKFIEFLPRYPVFSFNESIEVINLQN